MLQRKRGKRIFFLRFETTYINIQICPRTTCFSAPIIFFLNRNTVTGSLYTREELNFTGYRPFFTFRRWRSFGQKLLKLKMIIFFMILISQVSCGGWNHATFSKETQVSQNYQWQSAFVETFKRKWRKNEFKELEVFYWSNVKWYK